MSEKNVHKSWLIDFFFINKSSFAHKILKERLFVKRNILTMNFYKFKLLKYLILPPGRTLPGKRLIEEIPYCHPMWSDLWDWRTAVSMFHLCSNEFFFFFLTENQTDLFFGFILYLHKVNFSEEIVQIETDLNVNRLCIGISIYFSVVFLSHTKK